MAEAARTSFVGTKIAQGITEFAARLSRIDANLAAAVKNGSVQVVDSAIYTARPLASDTTIEIFQSADDKKVGVSNINKRQLEANTYMLVTAIQLVFGDCSGDKTMGEVDFGVIDETIGNGEFELKAGDKILMPRNSMEIFRTSQNSEEPAGMFKLDCPKLVSPLTDIVPQIWLPKAVTDKAVKVILHGVKTNKA